MISGPTYLGYLSALLAMLGFATNILLTKATVRLALNVGFVVAAVVNAVFCLLAFVIQLSLRHTAFQWNQQGFLAAGVCSTYLGRMAVSG